MLEFWMVTLLVWRRLTPKLLPALATWTLLTVVPVIHFQPGPEVAWAGTDSRVAVGETPVLVASGYPQAEGAAAQFSGMLAADAAFPATGRNVAPSAAAARAIVIAAVTVVAAVAFTARPGAVRVAALVFDVLVRLMGFRLLGFWCLPYAHYSAVSGGHSLEPSGL